MRPLGLPQPLGASAPQTQMVRRLVRSPLGQFTPSVQATAASSSDLSPRLLTLGQVLQADFLKRSALSRNIVGGLEESPDVTTAGIPSISSQRGDRPSPNSSDASPDPAPDTIKSALDDVEPDVKPLGQLKPLVPIRKLPLSPPSLSLPAIDSGTIQAQVQHQVQAQLAQPLAESPVADETRSPATTRVQTSLDLQADFLPAIDTSTQNLTPSPAKTSDVAEPTQLPSSDPRSRTATPPSPSPSVHPTLPSVQDTPGSPELSALAPERPESSELSAEEETLPEPIAPPLAQPASVPPPQLPLQTAEPPPSLLQPQSEAAFPAVEPTEPETREHLVNATPPTSEFETTADAPEAMVQPQLEASPEAATVDRPSPTPEATTLHRQADPFSSPTGATDQIQPFPDRQTASPTPIDTNSQALSPPVAETTDSSAPDQLVSSDPRSLAPFPPPRPHPSDQDFADEVDESVNQPQPTLDVERSEVPAADATNEPIEEMVQRQVDRTQPESPSESPPPSLPVHPSPPSVQDTPGSPELSALAPERPESGELSAEEETLLEPIAPPPAQPASVPPPLPLQPSEPPSSLLQPQSEAAFPAVEPTEPEPRDHLIDATPATSESEATANAPEAMVQPQPEASPEAATVDRPSPTPEATTLHRQADPFSSPTDAVAPAPSIAPSKAVSPEENQASAPIPVPTHQDEPEITASSSFPQLQTRAQPENLASSSEQPSLKPADSQADSLPATAFDRVPTPEAPIEEHIEEQWIDGQLSDRSPAQPSTPPTANLPSVEAIVQPKAQPKVEPPVDRQEINTFDIQQSLDTAVDTILEHTSEIDLDSGSPDSDSLDSGSIQAQANALNFLAHPPLGLAEPLATLPNLLMSNNLLMSKLGVKPNDLPDEPASVQSIAESALASVSSSSIPSDRPTPVSTLDTEPLVGWSSIEDLLEQFPSVPEPWEQLFHLESPLVPEQSGFMHTEPDSSDAELQSSMLSPLVEVIQPGVKAHVKEEQLEWLAQIVYGLIRDRLAVDRERYLQVVANHPPWLDIINPDTFKSIALTAEANAPDAQQQPLSTRYPPSRFLEALTQEVYQQVCLKLERDQERQGIHYKGRLSW